MKRYLFIIPVLLQALSCNTLYEKNMPRENNVAVRYINLKAVYNVVLNKNVEAVSIGNEILKIKADITDLKEKISLDNEKDEQVLQKIQKLTEEMQVLEAKEDALKAVIYKRIDRAIKKVARGQDVDFILSIGEGLVHAKKKYDITDAVIQELARADVRTEPVSR